jgi:putative phage-type endonuclease
MTPYELWQIRTGRKVQEVNAAMKHGADSEAAARAAYEALTGHVIELLVLVDGEYSASLDGMTLAGDLILEIKCAMKGRNSELWQQVATGALPDHYGWQVQLTGCPGVGVKNSIVLRNGFGTIAVRKIAVSCADRNATRSAAPEPGIRLAFVRQKRTAS